MENTFLLLHGIILIILVNLVICGDPVCPSNIETCYNCEVIGGCLQGQYSNITEEECLASLTSQVTIWSVEYNATTGGCRESNCEDIKIQYREGSVIHRKMCVTECASYMLTLMPNNKVTSVESEAHNSTGKKDWECLSLCLSENRNCTVSYEQNNERCVLYNDCLDECSLKENEVSWDVYTKTCGHPDTLPQITTTETATTSQTTPSPITSSFPTSMSASTTSSAISTTSVPTTSSATLTTSTPTTSSSMSTTLTQTNQSSTSSSTGKTVTNLYIMPCACYHNKTFTNMTQDKIIAQLIKDTKIDTKKTTVAQSKLISRHDSRASSLLIGTIGLVILCSLGGIMLCCDIMTLLSVTPTSPKKNINNKKRKQTATNITSLENQEKSFVA